MIQKQEIDQMAESFQVHPSNIQKDYVHGWLLSQLYSSSNLADRLVLKGGNSLRKGYFENARYSSDLDFTTTVGIPNDELHNELNVICARLSDKSGVIFDTSRTRVADKRNIDAEKKVSEARLYFRDFYGKENELVLAVKMDVTQFDRLYLPVQERILIHPYSDYEACKTMIRCVKLEETMAAKMRCLLQRRHIADLFDLVYATIINPEIEISRAEVISTFFKITIFERSPKIVKGLFLDLPMQALGSLWTKYIYCPNVSFFDFEKAKDGFFSLIDSLLPGEAERDYSTIFFPSSLRTPILEAADNHTLLRMTYDGMTRLVEPYELAFKIRKDGIAREYFYAFDTTGGRTSGPSLKSFLPGNVQSVEVTDQTFTPKYEIKTSKSGGAETVSHFYSTRRISLPRLRGIVNGPSRSRRILSSLGVDCVIECPYCNKRFRRKTTDTKLNKHNDSYGNPCYGRTGYIV